MRARFQLQFTSDGKTTELTSTRFESVLNDEVYQCIRGRVANGYKRRGTFQWTAGVIGMACTLLKAKYAATFLSSENWMSAAGVSSEFCEFAASFDYALSKQPAWLLDMLGNDQRGASLARRLFHRQNPERKRPGPVVIAVNTAFLEPVNIIVKLDNATLDKAKDLRLLLNHIGYKGPTIKAKMLKLSSSIKQQNQLTSSYPQVRTALNNNTALNLQILPLSTIIPQRELTLSQELDRIAHLVSDHIFMPYMADSKPEQWSCADALLGLIRHPQYRSKIQTAAPALISFLEPEPHGGYGIDECTAPLPVVTATCLMALCELTKLEGLNPINLNRTENFLRQALDHLLNSQAEGGWWSIISSPKNIIQDKTNARAWDTGYTTLALRHTKRTLKTGSKIDVVLNSAINWLISNYDPISGWTNSLASPLRSSMALTTFLHFVLLYCQIDDDSALSWNIKEALNHFNSLDSTTLWIEELDKRDYRLNNATNLALPHPHHIVHLAFALALHNQLKLRGLMGKMSHLSRVGISSTLPPGLCNSKAIYPYSQVLQAAYLFNN